MKGSTSPNVEIELIQALTDDYPFIFRVYPADDRIVFIRNDQYSREIFSHEEDMPYSKTLNVYTEKYVHPEDKQFFLSCCNLENLKDKLAVKKTYAGKFRAQFLGDVHYFKFKFARVSLAGEPLKIVGALNNVDELERDVQRRLAELETMRSILASSDMGTWQVIIRTERAPRLVPDHKMRELLGIPQDSTMSEEDIFIYFRSRVADVSEKDFQNYDRQMIENRRAEVTYQWNHPTLGVRWIRCGGTCIDIPGGFRLSGYHYDITEQKDKEIRTQQMLDDNIAANKTKTQFLQNMSHEIRTPLNAMFGFAQLLSLPEGSWTEEERQEYSAHIFNSYNMLDMLIGDIIDVADSEHGNYRIEVTDVNVNEICRNALMSVEYRKPMEVEMYYTSDVPDTHIIKSDGRRIQQVLINYLTNACKYTQTGHIHMHCSTSENPGKLTFSVTDTGKGVPADKADIIFNRFTKLNQFVQGSGLGLNICQMVATKLGGDVYLDKSYTDGARFVFVIDNQQTV